MSRHPAIQKGDTIINGLIFKCLCNNDPLCPLAEAHALPMRDRPEWASRLTDEKRAEVLKHYYLERHRLDSELFNASPLTGSLYRKLRDQLYSRKT